MEMEKKKKKKKKDPPPNNLIKGCNTIDHSI